MSKKQERVSVRKFEEAALGEFEHVSKIEWCGIEIEVKRNLTIKEMAQFVATAVRACFSQTDGTYAPEAKDFAVRTLIIIFYTNIALPSNMEKVYDCLYQSSIIQAVMQHVDDVQLDIVLKAIDSKVDHLAESHASELAKQIGNLESLGAQFSDILGGVTSQDIENVIGALSNGGVNEEKLMKAYIENK